MVIWFLNRPWGPVRCSRHPRLWITMETAVRSAGTSHRNLHLKKKNLHFIPSCTPCPGLISFTRKMFAGSAGFGYVQVAESPALGHQLLKSSSSVYLIQPLPRLPPLLLNRMEFAGTAASLFHLFNNCHDRAACQGVGRCSSEEEEGIALHAFAFI